MKVIILAGGLGTRLQEETSIKPKPMVEIGGQPIIWHIMKTFSKYGHEDFAIAMGYKAEVIRSYFLNYYHHHCDMTVHLKNGRVDVVDGDHENWNIFLADTGLNTMTGGRIRRLAAWTDRQTFVMTYGDGVSDINIDNLLRFHRKHGKLVTITAVRPPSRFGGINISDEQVLTFDEKPQIGEGWINGGFFVLEPQIFDYLEGDETIFEKSPLEKLAKDGQLMAYKHEGFWQCMDTVRELQLLERLWSSGEAPWRTWS
jgi:glucose-1-phosphate cytidylyltransferase